MSISRSRIRTCLFMYRLGSSETASQDCPSGMPMLKPLYQLVPSSSGIGYLAASRSSRPRSPHSRVRRPCMEKVKPMGCLGSSFLFVDLYKHQRLPIVHPFPSLSITSSFSTFASILHPRAWILCKHHNACRFQKA